MTYPNCTFTTNGLSLLVLIIMLTMGGCTDSSHIEESDMLIVEVPEGHDDNIALEELAEPVALIQLETREEAFITSIKDIHFQNEMLIVSTQDNQVLIFDMDGEYFGKLGKKGEGPSEYNFVSALSVDNDEDGKIYLSSGRKLMAYSAEYELLEEVKLDMHFDYLRVLDGQLYGFTQDYGVPVPNGYANRTKFHTISQDMKIEETLEIREVVNDTDVMATPGFKYYLSLVDADRYVYTPNLTPEKILRDTLFQINDGSLKPFAKLNFKKPHVNDQGYRRYHIFNIVNTPSHITSNYVGEGGDHFLFLHQKETGRSYNFKSGVLDNQGDRVMLKPLISEENIYYYTKKQEYTDQSNQEKNPTIGIVRLK